MKYHNSPNGPRPCEAKVKGCKYAEQGLPHFETQAEAQSVYDATMTANFGAFDTLKRSKIERARQGVYNKTDKTLALIQKAKASKAVHKTVATIETIKNSPQRTKALAGTAKERFKDSIKKLQISASSLVETIKMNAAYSPAKQEAREKYETLNSIDIQQARAEMNGRAPRERTSLKTRAKQATVNIGKMSVYRDKSAKHVALGDRLSDGSKVVSVASYDGNVYINTLADNGEFGTMRLNNLDVVTTHTTVNDKIQKIKDSPLYRRVAAATQLQKESYKALRGQNRQSAAMNAHTHSQTQSAIHGNKQEYARGA